MIRVIPAPSPLDVTYSVIGSEMTIETQAVTDADTVFGTTNHAYWNLAGTGTIADHELLAPADSVVEVDTELIPTGNLIAVADTRFDFSVATSLGSIVESGGIDHCLAVDGGDVFAQLTHRGSGRVLTLRSNQRGLQVYTGQYLPEPFSGLCLEPQALPDTPNQPHFGSCLLRVGDTYLHHSSYQFGVMAAG